MEEAFEFVAKQGGPDGCSSTGENKRMNSTKDVALAGPVWVGLGRDRTGDGQGSLHPPVGRWS